MKKILALAMAFLLAVSTLAGCGIVRNISGGKNTEDRIEEAGKNIAKDLIDLSGASEEEREQAKDFIDGINNSDWPSGKLPDDMPVYPDGKFTVLSSGDTTFVTISETSEDTIEKYIETLRGKGWTFENEKEAGILGIHQASKDGWVATIMKIDKDSLTLSVGKK
jgi:hypothetical protein